MTGLQGIAPAGGAVPGMAAQAVALRTVRSRGRC